MKPHPNKIKTLVRVNWDTPSALREWAAHFNFISKRGNTVGEPSISQLLDAIAAGDIILQRRKY